MEEVLAVARDGVCVRSLTEGEARDESDELAMGSGFLIEAEPWR